MKADRFISADAIRAEVKRFVLTSDTLAEAIGISLGRLRRELEEQINDLRRAMAEFNFKGAWVEGEQYKRGNFCSQGGAVYHCQVDTQSRPGTDDKVWTLAVPRARDGRDGRDFVPPEPSQRTVRSARR